MRYAYCAIALFLLQFFAVVIEAFFERQLRFKIAEGVPIGSLIGRVPLNDGLKYQLNGRCEFATFNSDNGEIRSSVILDRESTSMNGTFNMILVAQPAAIISVFIEVLDVNDNDPVFPSPFMNVSIVESAAVGSRVAVHSATDADFAENGTIVAYGIENTQSVFTLVRSTSHSGDDVLLLELAKPLDRETKDLYVINVSASDGGHPPRFGYSTVVVNVLDANDNAPVFEQPFYEVSISSHPGHGSNILTVKASDGDIGDNARIIYRISNDAQDQFEINRHNGTIYAKKDELNCSRAGCDQNCSRICVISVEAEDQGKPKLLGRAFVNIALKETNDHNPVIHFKMYPAGMGFASISEEAIMGTTIAVVTVTDEDYGQNSQIEIIAGNEENFFRLESGNNFAIVRLNRLLSERHSDPFRLTFRAKDDGLPSRHSLKDLEVFVLRADDKAPVLDSATVEAQVFEDSPLGSLITVVHASGNSSLLYTIIEDTSNGSFKIGAHSGIITVAKPLSATTLHSALVRVEVKNKKPSIKSSICVITILIVGVNNNSPIFEKDYYLIETVENTPLLSVISKVRAHDEDDGINSQLSYSIVENVAKHTFAIKEKSGEIFVRRVLDRELQDRYVFTVRASDHGYPQRFGTAQVIVNVLDVNDNRPYFLQEQYFCFVRKNELPGSEIIRVEARDLDSGRYGEVGYLLYQSPMGLFELQHASGTLRLATSLGALAEREFQVLIGAKDGGGLLSLSNATVIVQIIDNDVYVLKFTPLKWNVDVAENSPTGTSIGTFAIENAERTDVRYRLSNSTLLQINERTGEIFLRQPIDREQIAIVPFTVFASVGHLTAQHSGLLQVLDRNDNSPQFEPGRSVSLSLTGHTTIGSELVRLLAVDADEGPNAIITYSIDNDHFDIGRETGVLIYRKRVENADQVQFHVIARDGGDPPLVGSIRVIVDVERDEPIHNFPAEIALTIAEGARPGTLIRTLAPVNTTRHYEFWANVPHSDEYAVWILTSGEVFVVSTLDREINPVIRIPITVAISIGSYRCQQSVLLIIYVEDINDNAPECPPTNTFSVVENDLSTSVVGVLNSIDKDAGLNGTVFFEMGERNTNFTIDRNFGVIRTTVSLDRESIDSYNLTIILSDGGGLKTECKVEITVKDVNDNAPIMKSAFYHFDVVDLKKHLIGYVRATDRDQGLNGEIRYYLARQSTHIKIDAFTGELSHDGELKPGKVYNLTIVAEDQGRPQLSTSALAFVYVREQKRCSPRFVVYPTKTIEIVESIPLGSLVASVVASACDDLIIYSILDGNYDSAFWIDPDDGTVIVVRSLDFEQRNSYRLTISASTSFGNTSILLVFDVRDINDNGPEIETDVIRVKENNEPGSLCGQIAVMDADSDNNGRVHLEILHQLPLEHQFHLDGTKLICDNVLDREHIHNHRLLVKATDYGNPTKSTQKMIAVEVEDENDNAPICRGVETFLVGSEPINVKWNCFDMDEALNGRIGYEILHATEAVTQIREDLVKIEPIQREPQRFSVRVFDRYTNESMSDDPSRKSIERYFTILPRNPSDFIHFDASLESIQVSLDTPLGTVIGRITASAPSTIEYYITSFRYDHEDVVRWLDIDRSNGQLLLVRKPTNLEVDIEITAFSNGFIASKTIKVRTDGLENAYEDIRPLFFDFEVLEDVRLGYIVGSVALEGNSNWKYHSVSSEGNDYFDVDSTNGDIMTKSKLDYELVHDVILEIIASKSGQHSNVERSISVYVRIVDVNDNRPEFAESTTWMVIKENSAIGTFIGQVSAEDKDSGDYGTIDYALVSAPSAVRIDQKSGIITVAGSIDREKESVYHFKVRATDVGGLSSEIEVLLFVADKNDNVPRFELESYSTEIPENVNVGTKLLTLNVVDEDSDYDFSFEIDRRGNERRLFAIDQDGIVYVAAPLDREYNAKHSLRIIVTDQKPPHKVFSASTTLSVIVTDVNDNAPKFTSPSTFFVFEEVPLGTLVGIVNAVDADFGNNAQLQYRVLPASHPEAIFIVDPVFGYIQVNGRLDREKRSVYHLTIDATDRGSPSLTSSTNITIVLLDIDDNESILNEVYYGKIAENSPIGQHVVHVTFEDVDEVENSAKIFAIESGDPDNDFRISTRSGLIVVNKHLDAEYRRVQIEVIDVNDERPRFKEGDHLVFAVAENLRGPYPIVLGSTIAEDRDQDQNGTISYAIVQGDTSLFSVDSQSGKLCLNVALDREQQAEHHLKVQAIDLGTPRLSATVKITILVEDLNDNDPVFHLPYYRASIRENSLPDELVAQLKATDADASENARLRYSLVEEGTIPFRIDASTGIVYTTVRLDRELASSWHLKVIAQDSGEFVQRSATVSLTVTVTDENDNAPIILNDLFDVYIPEGILKNDIVHAVRAYDADENETLTYTLSGPDKSFFVVDEDGAIIASTDLRKKDFTITVTVTDEGGHNASITLNFYSSAALNFPVFMESHVREFTVKEGGEGKPITTFIARSLNISSYGIQYAIAGGDPFKDFSIHPRSGQLFTSAKVDYERRKRYRLLISAIDQHHHPLVSLAPIVVNVEDINDNRPVFDKILYEAEIGENIDGGTSLLRVNASDKDASLNGDVRYSIVEEEMNKLFRIDENSGEIFTLVTLDADVNSKYRFEVKAVDRGQPALSEVAVVEVRVIDENDNSPKFSRLFRAEIEENSPIGAFVTQVSSIDADVYSVVAYELEDNSTNTFQIDPHSGNVTLASYIDREKQSEYALKVRAMDGVWQVRTSLTISVLDQNDNAPSFIRQHFRFFVLSNTSVGCTVGRIRATDADSAENGVVFYSLECPQDRFTVDPITGSVSLSLPLGDYTNVTFSCEAIAVDGGLPSLKAMAVVDIDVVDDGVVAPRFIDRHPYFAVLANSSEGTIIGELLTESPTYYVVFSVDDDRFAVDQNGTMLAKSNFTMFEVGSSITLSIQALFEEPSTLSDEINVTMETADVNRNAPKFTSKRITFSVPENSALLTAVGTVSAHDDDLGVNGRIIYTMETNETEKVPFSVNATSGTIFVIGSLDYEEKRMYRFFVVASDCGLPPQKATAQVMVNITDENDNVPQFEEDFIIVHILENTVPGTAIADLMAVDLDSGDYGTVVYGIESNDDARLPFTVNATNGQVIVSSLIDYELKNSYHFYVTARNPGESTQAYANVEVIVDSQNEFKPKFLTAKQNFEVSSRALKGTIIGKVSAVDLDEGRHGRIIYATPINNIAEISAASGEILVKSMLNGSLDKTVLEVVAMNVQLTRFDREMPHRMTVEVVRKDVPPTPLLLKHYAFNLSEEAQLSTRLKLLSPSVLPSGVRLEILNGGFEQPFCSEQGMASLRLCGPLDHERTAKHEFEVALIRDSRTLSQSKVTVSILESNNNTLPRIDIDTAVGFIRENSPASSTVTRLRPIIQGPAGLRQAFTYRIMDTDLAKIFAVDESTAVMNTAITLDREIRSQYVIPISISAVGMPSISTTYNVRVYVDDARDNMAEMGSRLVIVEKTIADDGENNVDSIEAIHILPRCRDEVSSTDFICETRNNGTKVMVSSNCKVQLNREVRSETTLSLEAYDRHYLSNVTFFSLIKQRAVDAFIYNNSVSVDVWAMLASIADMVDLLQESVPDMTVRLVGVEHFGLDSYRLLMAVFDRNGAIVTADETARMLKHFYSKKNVELNVFVRALMADICAMPDGCLNGGVCQQTTSPTRQYQQLDGYKSSFVIPIVKRRRRCLCKRLTNGERCELKTEMCSAKKPCVNGGICDPYSGLCSCSPSYTGTHCEEDVNECTQKNICGGGQCINMPGSFKCVCPLGFTGSRCETRLDLCDSVLCISGKCVNDENGASRCECNSGYQGHSCELRSRAFDSGSYMEIRLPPVSNEISLEFKTFASSALLLYSYSEGNLNDFAVVDIIKGRIRFSVRLDDITIVNIVLNGTVNDGMWKRVRLEQKWHTIRMTVEECTDDGYCQPCEKAICSRLGIMRTSYLWIASKTAFVGGIKNIEDVIKRPNQISSIDFVGCLRRFEVDGVSLERLETLSEAGLTMGCPSERQTCQIGRMIAECMNGVCMRDERGGAKCVCADGFDAASCRHSMEEWTLNGGEVRFALTQYVRRQISFVPVQEADLLTSDGMIRRRRDTLRDIPCEEMDYTEGDQLDGVVTQWAELDFRTTANYGTVFAIVEESKSSHMKIENGSLHFVTYLTDANPIDVHLDDKINDGKWHRLGFQIGVDQKTIRFQLDGHGKEIHADEEFPALISRSLSFVCIGVANEAEAFTGCVRRFILNNQAQSFNVNDDSLLAEQLLRIVSVRFISSGCGTPVRFSSASLQWHDVWTIVGVILAVIAICLTSLAAWLSWRRCGHKCGWRSKVQQQRNNLRLFSVSTDSMHAGQKHSNYSTSHRQIPSPWLYASMSAVQALQEIYSVGHPSRNGSSGLGSSGNTPSEDGYQNIERSMQVETTQTIRSRQHASESKSSVSRQLKAALRQSESSLRDSALPASSSECSYEELPSRRRRRRSRRKRDTYTNASYSVSPNETGIGMSDPAVRQTRVPRMETERDDCTRSSGVGSESCTTIINRPLSDTESDTTIAAQVPRSLAAFRAPRSVFADSDSSMEGNQRMDAIIGYGRPPTYV